MPLEATDIGAFNVGSMRILGKDSAAEGQLMNTTDAKSKPALGFLTVVEHPQYGLFGGYLILNTAGRPLEFHCTAPIKPNRAQEILYGPTLESFLYGEQIGQTLINQASIAPLLICTDREPALAAREHVSTPVVLVLPPEDETVAEQAAELRARTNRAASCGSTPPTAAAHGWRPSSLAETAWPCPSGPTKTAG